MSQVPIDRSVSEHRSAGAAIDRARQIAAREQRPVTVWRRLDRDCRWIVSDAELYGPAHPVAVVDPDGTAISL